MEISTGRRKCKTDPVIEFCYVWRRNNKKKKTWKNENTTVEWKKKNLIEIKSRLKGWQLESFEESYKHKIENGISLLKKEMLK